MFLGSENISSRKIRNKVAKERELIGSSIKLSIAMTNATEKIRIRPKTLQEPG